MNRKYVSILPGDSIIFKDCDDSLIAIDGIEDIRCYRNNSGTSVSICIHAKDYNRISKELIRDVVTCDEIVATPEDVIGKTCYKIYVIAERSRFPGTYYDYFCDTPSCLKYWISHISHGGEATLYVRERPFTKSDRLKLGKTVFWTREEAEDAIGLLKEDEK